MMPQPCSILPHDSSIAEARHQRFAYKSVHLGALHWDTSQFTLGHYTGTKLNGTISDDQYMRFKRDASDYLSQFLTFFNKYPEVSQIFIEDLVHCRLTLS